MLTLKDHVSGPVTFQYYRAGNLVYKTVTELEFPVPISDTDGATFPSSEKGIFFLRWIRKHLEDNNLNMPDVVEHFTMRTASEIETERLAKKFDKFTT